MSWAEVMDEYEKLRAITSGYADRCTARAAQETECTTLLGSKPMKGKWRQKDQANRERARQTITALAKEQSEDFRDMSGAKRVQESKVFALLLGCKLSEIPRRIQCTNEVQQWHPWLWSTQTNPEGYARDRADIDAFLFRHLGFEATTRWERVPEGGNRAVVITNLEAPTELAYIVLSLISSDLFHVLIWDNFRAVNLKAMFGPGRRNWWDDGADATRERAKAQSIVLDAMR